MDAPLPQQTQAALPLQKLPPAETTAAAITDSSAASADSSDLPDDLNELFQMENDIFAEHNTLWEKVFASMDKATPPASDDYASFLAATIDAIKEELSEEDLATLNADVEQIRKIEDKMTEVQSTDSDTIFGSDISAGEKFPAFEGTDFDGNAISDSIFSEHAVTLVNFWFNECSPCVEELPTLSELNKTLRKKAARSSVSTRRYSTIMRTPSLPRRNFWPRRALPTRI